MRARSGLFAAAALGLVLPTLVLVPQSVLAATALPSNCTLGADLLTVTCTFAYTGAEQTFTVPPDVTSISVNAIGAAGGTSFGGAVAGGRGEMVTSPVAVPAGVSTLYVEVGQAPDTVTTAQGEEQTAFNGGGLPGYGEDAGGGGGASDVRTIGRALTGSLASRLVVAGGGGGAAEENPDDDPGGDAGVAGVPSTQSDSNGQGGGAGTETMGGAVGSVGPNSDSGGQTAGTLGVGGAGGGGQPSGGGGGGGYYGGGGGSAGGNFVDPDEECAAGSGGGGSSLVPMGGSQTLTSAAASVTITYALAGVAPVITKQPTDQTVTAGQTATFTVQATGVPAPTVQWFRAGEAGDHFSPSAKGDTYTFVDTTTYDTGIEVEAQISNASGDVTSVVATLTVNAPASAGTPPTFQTGGSLPGGTVGTAYSATITDSGSPAPTDAIVGGSLPPGLALNGDPVLAGTPTTAGTYTFTLRATNSAGDTDRAFTVTIAPASAPVTPIKPVVPVSPPLNPVEPHTLPFTGLMAAPLVAIGLLALVGGALLQAMGRRRPW